MVHQLCDLAISPACPTAASCRYIPASTLCQGIAASVVRRAADAVTNLAHENVVIKSRVRSEGGIPPLCSLLVSTQVFEPAEAGDPFASIH